MTPADYIQAARVPETLPEQDFGLWQLRRVYARDKVHRRLIGGRYQTCLHRMTQATMHLQLGVVVMEDSTRELERHLPIWMAGRGRVLVTGLGLGCVVRGLLASPAVEHVDVVEIDAGIIKVIGAEFEGNQRVRIHRGDALTFPVPEGARWDFAWHDLWIEDEKRLQFAHVEAMRHVLERTERQGAWAFPKHLKRRVEWIFG